MSKVNTHHNGRPRRTSVKEDLENYILHRTKYVEHWKDKGPEKKNSERLDLEKIKDCSIKSKIIKEKNIWDFITGIK